MLKGNAIIGQSGGPTAVINASLMGVVQTALKSEFIESMYGMRYGIEGFMEEYIVDFGHESPATLEALKTTPSSALGSCRLKLQDEHLPRILDLLKKLNIRYMFLIGGNDSMDTIHRVEAYAKANGYELIGIGIAKTVDNDLFGTDHTPGFASAARYMALSVQHAGILARDMQKVDQYTIFQCVGREAGWLVGATAVGKEREADAPHIMCLPERPFEKDKFLADVKRCYDAYGFVSIVCGEGITYADGRPVSASETNDKFGNVEFGAMGGTSAAMALHKMIADKFDFRGEFQVTESLAMCAADRAVQQDLDEAYHCGVKAVELAAAGTTGVMVAMQRAEGVEYICEYITVPLHEVAANTKPMPDAYINAEGNFITDAFLDYIKPLIGPLPSHGRLSDARIAVPAK
jgi:ATP-dependent phosphofructokinase / diphosphate-dependent phosphofructokinase